MSHLRAPAAHADRREGGRHGRPDPRAVPPPTETRIRRRLLRLAILPPLAVALSACAAVLFLVCFSGAHPTPTPALWVVLAGALAVALGALAIAVVAAERAAGSVYDGLEMLRRANARGEDALRDLVEALRRGEPPPARTARGGPAADADDFELLAAELARAHDGAVVAVVRAAQLSSHTGSEQKLEVFVHLARRLQSLVHREISILDELENGIEDPDLLQGLFRIDHLATRIRRHAENLAVLGGAVSRRQWSNPIPVTEVLRSAIAEVDEYVRVKLVPPVEGTLRGHAVADVVHLLAELIENATVYSAPHTQVLLRAELVTSGLAIEVEDRGLGMSLAEQDTMNALLAEPDQVNVATLLAEGRIGLFVVSQLARRHGIHVRLQTNIYGGVQAVLVVPQGLLGPAPVTAGTRSPELPRGADAGQMPYGTGPFGMPGVTGAWGVAPAITPVPVPAPVPASAPGSDSSPVASEHSVFPGRRQTEHEGVLGDRDRFPEDPDRLPVDRGRPSVDGEGPESVGEGPASDGGWPASDGERSELDSERPEFDHDRVPTGHVQTVTDQDQPQTGPARTPDDHVRASGGGEGTPIDCPAEQWPGVPPGDGVAGNAEAPAVRQGGARPDTSGRPRLPRRRAQEHIAPQLRDGPTPRTLPQDADRYVPHDPGLMAAFRRGIGLAEARERAEPDHAEAYTDPAQVASPHGDLLPVGSPDLSATPSDGVPELSRAVPQGNPARTAEAYAPHRSADDPAAPHMGSAPAG
ncbi:ATP-binding protein [Streptomyces sp. SID2888]|uniref:sensor histidine kinase n=1 Tax=Streptomyces sp. SID2888 TaxID=2690256 RepID=UPI001F358074|nr:ATP-binding protein [Streptomyces sp. SID2888]